MHFGLQRAAAFVSSPMHLLLEKQAKPCFAERTSVKSGTAAALLSVLMVPLMIDDDDDLHSTPRYGGPRRYNAICHDVWYEKN